MEATWKSDSDCDWFKLNLNQIILTLFSHLILKLEELQGSFNQMKVIKS